VAKDVEEGKGCAILLWVIWIVGLIWWLADEKMKKNSFVKFWVKQWLILVILAVAVSILGSIPIIGWLFIMPLGWIFVFVLWVIGLIAIIKGEEKILPVIGKFGQEWFKF